MSFGRTLAGIKVDDSQFLSSLSLEELVEVVVPGRAFLPKAKNDPITSRRVANLAPYHDKIQRDLSGRKLSNARGDLKRYLLEEWIDESQSGVLPPFILWFPEKLQIEATDEGPLSRASIPPSNKALLLDAESRVEAALHAVDEASDAQLKALLAKRVAVVIFHGLDVQRAAKYFADINGKGVGVTPNLTVSRDFKDQWAVTSLAVFEELGIEVEKRKRQVSTRGPEVLTAVQARTMVAALFHGVNAVSYGAKPIPRTRDEGDEVEFERLRQEATEWLGGVFNHFGEDAFKDKDLVLRSVPVVVSIGALGKAFYSGDERGRSRALEVLTDESIDWEKGPRWAGIAGKVNSKGNFSVGSGKENAWATYRALTDSKDPGYGRIRREEQGNSR